LTVHADGAENEKDPLPSTKVPDFRSGVEVCRNMFQPGVWWTST